MRVSCVLAAVLLVGSASAVRLRAQGAAGSANADAPAIRTGANLVLETVTVEDRKGQPVQGLGRDSFAVTDDRTPEPVSNFEEYGAFGTAAKSGEAPIPALPPDTFTNDTSTPKSRALTVILLDALNTPVTDQTYLYTQLAEYVKHAEPNQEIAIFGLNDRLILLQGFTSDPEILRRAIEYRLHPGISPLLENPNGGGTKDQSLSRQVAEAIHAQATPYKVDSLVAALAAFEVEAIQSRMQTRVQTTLDAFDALAHYLADFPGRKNLIWFSGAFPLDFGNLRFAFQNDDALQRTSALLARAQVAVYPIDARGLAVGSSILSAGNNDGTSGQAGNYGGNVVGFNVGVSADHATMSRLAEETGGHAFFNTNGLVEAVRKVLASGSDYYVLSYTPPHAGDGSYHQVHIALVGAAAAKHDQLAYREGYFAEPAAAAPGRNESGPAAQSAYGRAAMAFGGPPARDILFRASVKPATANGAGGVQNGKDGGSSRAFEVTYTVATSGFTLTSAADGETKDAVEFLAVVYDGAGKLLSSGGKRVNLVLPARGAPRFESLQMQVQAPAKTPAMLRLVIREVATDRYGSLEVPLGELKSATASAVPAPAP